MHTSHSQPPLAFVAFLSLNSLTQRQPVLTLGTAKRARSSPKRPSLPPMATLIWKGNCPSDISSAGSALASGALVAFPTETVYGLGANAEDDAAVQSVFSAKKRPSDNPLIVHFPSKTALEDSNVIRKPLGPLARIVTDKFWPGPLTVVLPCGPDARVSRFVTAGLSSVAVRVPAHPVARALLESAGVPVAAPSANASGRPSPTEAAHVLADLDGRIAGVVQTKCDGLENGEQSTSAHKFGLESTVVDLTDETCPTVLRPGAVAVADLERVCGVPFGRHAPKEAMDGKIAEPLAEPSPKSAAASGLDRCGGESLDGALDGVSQQSKPASQQLRPKAPGMKYRHYAPRAPVVLCSLANLRLELTNQLEAHRAGSVGLLADSETCDEVCKSAIDGSERIICAPCGHRHDVSSFGRDLYAKLRAFDGEGDLRMPAAGVKVIVAVELENAQDGIAAAAMNRLRKAANASAEHV